MNSREVDLNDGVGEQIKYNENNGYIIIKMNKLCRNWRKLHIIRLKNFEECP